MKYERFAIQDHLGNAGPFKLQFKLDHFPFVRSRSFNRHKMTSWFERKSKSSHPSALYQSASVETAPQGAAPAGFRQSRDDRGSQRPTYRDKSSRESSSVLESASDPRYNHGYDASSRIDAQHAYYNHPDEMIRQPVGGTRITNPNEQNVLTIL